MTFAAKRMYIAGTGSAVPERVLTNDDLSKMVDTNDAWIQERTGIKERRVVRPGTGTSELAEPAARRALEAAGVEPADVDLIVVGTVTPDTMFPSTACHLQVRLGATRAACFDVSAACSGFLYSLEAGRAMAATGPYQNVLVVGADIMSAVADYRDRNTCILFGDAAGAVVLRPAAEGQGHVIRSVLGAAGNEKLLSMPAGGSRMPATHETVEARLHYIHMEGREVFKFAVTKMIAMLEAVVDGTEYKLSDLDFVVPHQVNQRVFDMVFRKLDIPPEKVIVNLDRYGNTSAGSVPLALDEAVRTGRIHRGDLVALVAFGAGLTWGATLIRW